MQKHVDLAVHILVCMRSRYKGLDINSKVNFGGGNISKSLFMKGQGERPPYIIPKKNGGQSFIAGTVSKQ